MRRQTPTKDLTKRCSRRLADVMTSSQHVYEIRPRKDHRGVALISDALPFGRLMIWRAERNQEYNRLRKVFTAAHMML